MSQAPHSSERVVYSVSRLNRDVRILLERRVPVIWIEGELSNLSQPASGHWYFSLKDRQASIRCAMFRTRTLGIGFSPRAGQQVLARGRVSLYEARGEFQLIVEHLEEAGLGALQREFERLKAKLAAEGLFAEERKRRWPRFPARIGVVTSPTGAAVRDILHVLRRRFPPAAVLVYPTPVQGAAAAPAIVDALALASTRAECDVLVLARGGGSLEDLWAFNDERVARAIRHSAIPVVAGIGHEIDFTIADFAADARAPTPSGAAELVTPDRLELAQLLSHAAERLARSTRRELRTLAGRVAHAAARLHVAHPGARLRQQAQRLDDLEQRLAGALRSTVDRKTHRLSDAFGSLVRRSPEHQIREYGMRQTALTARLQHATLRRLASVEHRLSLAARALDAVSPLKTLERGFAIVTRASDGSVVTQAQAIEVGESIEARLAHGRLRAIVTGRDGAKP
ncbi:MAG TPA: exodeoxyribonuclease VII large subunit [Steroidobacteraceae bacterium]|nr:exodeoxyribonuclease VII large subunit [Steroidobacteraceae bacterium]